MKQKFMLGVISFGVISLLLVGLSSLPPTLDGDSAITVMSYNVHLYYDEGTGGQNNLDAVRDLIASTGADIVGLQESEGNRAVSSNQDGVRWLATELDMAYYSGPDSRDDVWGVSLLSKYPILDVETVALPSEEALNRVAIVATLEYNSAEFKVVNTHLTFQSPEDQLGQIQTIIDLTDSFTVPFVIMGDFNTVLAQEDGDDLATDPSYQLLSATYNDGFVQAGGDAEATTSFYYEDRIPNARIDYIWLSSGWSVSTNSAEVLGDRSISDHRAIVITISML